jgi:hypothetical protein
MALLTILAASLLGRWLGRLPESLIAPILLSLTIAVLGHRLLSFAPPPLKRIRADMLARTTPSDAMIITWQNLAYLEPLVLRGTKRRAIPFCRSVEYTTGLVAWKKVPDPKPAPRGPFDPDRQGLAAGGAREAIPYVACERADDLAREIARGLPVFIDIIVVPRPDVDLVRKFMSRFRPIAWPGAPGLYRLQSAGAAGG